MNRGADIQAQMVDGATPLFITAQNGHHELLKFLLKKGAEVDIKRKVSKDEPRHEKTIVLVSDLV